MSLAAYAPNVARPCPRSWSLVLCAALAISGPAAAQPTPATDEAEALFTDARRLLAEGKPEQACPKFEQSQTIDPAAGTLMNLGRCYALLGRTASAWGAYRAAASLSSAAGQTKREQVARAQADALEPELAKATIHAPDGALPTGLEILLDGLVWRGANAATPVDPGSHTIVARAPGFFQWSEQFEAVPREHTAIRVPALRALPAEPALALPNVTPPAPLPQPAPLAAAPLSTALAPGVPQSVSNGGFSPGKMRSLGIVLSGAGIVGLGLGAGLGLRARQLNADSREANHCEAVGCDTPGLELNHAALDAAAVSTVAFVSGAVLSAAGVTLYVLGSSRHSSVSLALSPAVTTSGTSFVLLGRL